MKRKLTDEQIEQMIELYLEHNLSYSELAECFGVSRQTVGNWFEKKGVRARKRTHSEKFVSAMQAQRTRLDQSVLEKLYLDEKLSIHKTAEKIGTNYHNVRANLIRYKIPLRANEIYTTSRLTDELLKRLYIDERLTAAQIADRLGYSKLTVRKRLHKFGIRKSQPAPTAAATPPAPENEPRFLTPAEIARRYNYDVATVRRLLKNKLFPNAVEKKVGKKTFWSVPSGDLENFTPRARGGQRAKQPSVETILKRGQKAEKEIKEIYGYGKSDLVEMIALEKNGLTGKEIAVRLRIEERLVEDILEKARFRPPRLKKTPRKRALKRLPKDELLELYSNSALSVKYILEKLGTNYASLYINLRYHEIPLRDNESRLSASEKEQTIRRLSLDEERTPREIADFLNLSESYVKRKLKELKISRI